MTRPTHAGPIIGGVLLAFLAVGMAGFGWLRRIEAAIAAVAAGPEGFDR